MGGMHCYGFVPDSVPLPLHYEQPFPVRLDLTAQFRIAYWQFHWVSYQDIPEHSGTPHDCGLVPDKIPCPLHLLHPLPVWCALISQSIITGLHIQLMSNHPIPEHWGIWHIWGLVIERNPSPLQSEHPNPPKSALIIQLAIAAWHIQAESYHDIPVHYGGTHYWGLVPESVPAPLHYEHPFPDRSAFVIQLRTAA